MEASNVELLYKGEVRALRGSAMAFAHPEGKFNDEHMHSFLSLGIQDMAIRLDNINDGGIDFTISFYRNEKHYHLSPGETVVVKEEGNAFACELYFTIG